MPAVAALGPLVIALLALVLAIAADILLRAIGKAIGSVGIGPVTWDIGSFFVGKAEGLLSWAVNNLDGYFNDAANWFVAHILVLQQLGGAVVSAVTHLGDQIAHIVNTSIPNAISAAESAAGAHAQSLVNGVEHDLTSDFNSLTDTLNGDVKAINSTISSDVTDLTNLVSKSVTAGVAKAEGYTDDAINTLTGVVNHDLSVAESYTNSSVNALAQTLGQQLSSLTDTVASNLAQAEDYAKAQANTVYQEVETDLGQAQQTLQAGINAAEAGVQSAVSTAESFASTAAGDAATTAEQALEGALGGIYTDLTGKALAVNGDLSTVEGLVAGAILSSVGAIAARVSTLEECSVGVCDDSPNNFSNLLNDALGLASVAGVGVFLAQLINSPASAGQEYAGAIGGLFGAGQSALDALLSL